MMCMSESHDSVVARPALGPPLQVGLEDAVEQARRLLGAREVAPEPEELLRYPGEHCCCCCCWTWPVQAP